MGQLAVISVTSTSSNKQTLDKHMYSHSELNFTCETCGESFLFQSHLDQHMLINQLEHLMSCPKKNCDHKFKDVGNLNCHVHTHKKVAGADVTIVTIKTRTYETLPLILRTHTKDGEQYECNKCHKKMCFSTQYKHRREHGYKV